jgi:hypothetical protein
VGLAPGDAEANAIDMSTIATQAVSNQVQSATTPQIVASSFSGLNGSVTPLGTTYINVITYPPLAADDIAGIHFFIPVKITVGGSTSGNTQVLFQVLEGSNIYPSSTDAVAAIYNDVAGQIINTSVHIFVPGNVKGKQFTIRCKLAAGTTISRIDIYPSYYTISSL